MGSFYGIIRKSVANIAAVDFVNASWNSISSLMNQIEQNPAFLTRTPSMIYNENIMDIGQPLLLSPSLRAHSVTTLQRQNSLQHLEPLNGVNSINNLLSHHHQQHEMIDVD